MSPSTLRWLVLSGVTMVVSLGVTAWWATAGYQLVWIAAVCAVMEAVTFGGCIEKGLHERQGLFRVPESRAVRESARSGARDSRAETRRSRVARDSGL